MFVVNREKNCTVLTCSKPLNQSEVDKRKKNWLPEKKNRKKDASKGNQRRGGGSEQVHQGGKERVNDTGTHGGCGGCGEPCKWSKLTTAKKRGIKRM